MVYVMLLDDIATVLVDEGLGIVGGSSANLFKGYLPDLPAASAALYEYPGEPPLHVKDHPEPIHEMPRFQIVNRSGSPDEYASARLRAERIYQMLAGFSGKINDVYYARITALQSPFYMTRDDKNRALFVCNYAVRKELSPVS